MDRIPVITVTFIDSLFLKNTISLLNGEITSSMSVYFRPHDFGIDLCNDQGSAHHHIVFDPEELSEYYYNVRNDDGSLRDFHTITFEISSLHKIMESIGRHGQIRMILYQGEQVLVINSNMGEEATDHLVKLKAGKGGNRKYDWLDDFPLTCRLPVSKFSTIVSSTLKRRSANMVISYVVENGNRYIRFITTNKSNAIDSTKRISLQENSDEEDNEISINISLHTIRTLSKIEPISPSGNLLRLYFFKCKGNDCIRISSRIGTIGKYDVILKNDSSSSHDSK